MKSLSEKCLELLREIENLPASPQATNLSIICSDLSRDILLEDSPRGEWTPGQRRFLNLPDKAVDKNEAMLVSSVELGTKQAETECRLGSRIVELLGLMQQSAEALREIVAELATATQLSPGCQTQVDADILANSKFEQSSQ